MENHLIKDAQITASSSHYHTNNARLNLKASSSGGKRGSWSAASHDPNPWIQVALGSFTNITGIATQGRYGGSYRRIQWVTKYQLQYSDDGVNFRYYQALCESFPKVNLCIAQLTISNCCTHSWHLCSPQSIYTVLLLINEGGSIPLDR